MNQTIAAKFLLHRNSLKLFFSLILFVGLVGCSDDNTTTTPTTTTISTPASTTTTSSTTTTTTNPLQVTGIADDTTAHPSKTMTLDCEHDSDDEDCEFRFVINQSDSYEFSHDDDYEDIKTATKSRGTDGTYYLHVQAKNSNNVESNVETVSFILEAATSISLRVTSLTDDTDPKSSKTWTWDCSDTPCEFRFEVNDDHNFEFDNNDSYNQTKSTSKTASTGQGTFYLHVQAKNTDDDEESAVKTVSFILEDLRVIGLADDDRERSSKRWNWNCNTPPLYLPS